VYRFGRNKSVHLSP